MDFKNYKFKMNMKSLLLFEKISGKSFFEISNEEDIEKLKYAILVKNNDDMTMTYDVYKVFARDKKVNKWLNESYLREASFISQTGLLNVGEKEDDGDEKDDDNDEVMTIGKIVSSLIVQYGIDAHYVMNEMSTYEIYDFFRAAEAKVKSELCDKRLWTYLQIAPQIDTKKIKSPEKLIPFSWEAKERKKKAEEELKRLSKGASIIGQKLNI